MGSHLSLPLSAPSISLFHSHTPKPPALFILGVHHSATSLLTRFVIELGDWDASSPARWMLADDAKPWRDNTKFFELRDAVSLDDAIYSHFPPSLHTPAWLGANVNVSNLPERARKSYTEAARAILRNMALDPNSPRVVKDPRMVLTLPIWIDAATQEQLQPVCLVLSRSVHDIAASLAPWVQKTRDAWQDIAQVHAVVESQLLNEWCKPYNTLVVRQEELRTHLPFVLRRVASWLQPLSRSESDESTVHAAIDQIQHLYGAPTHFPAPSTQPPPLQLRPFAFSLLPEHLSCISESPRQAEAAWLHAPHTTIWMDGDVTEAAWFAWWRYLGYSVMEASDPALPTCRPLDIHPPPPLHLSEGVDTFHWASDTHAPHDEFQPLITLVLHTQPAQQISEANAFMPAPLKSLGIDDMWLFQTLPPPTRPHRRTNYGADRPNVVHTPQTIPESEQLRQVAQYAVRKPFVLLCQDPASLSLLMSESPPHHQPQHWRQALLQLLAKPELVSVETSDCHRGVVYRTSFLENGLQMPGCVHGFDPQRTPTPVRAWGLVTVVAVAHENAYLRVLEWVAFHRGQGVVSVCVYVDDQHSSPEWVARLESDSSIQVRRVSATCNVKQPSTKQTDCFRHALASASPAPGVALAFIDVDEYLTHVHDSMTVLEVLQRLQRTNSAQVVAVHVRSILFGSSGLTNRPPSLARSFVKRMEYDWLPPKREEDLVRFRQGKVIVLDPALVAPSTHAHYFVPACGKIVLNDHAQPQHGISVYDHPKLLFLAHYKAQTPQDWSEKRAMPVVQGRAEEKWLLYANTWEGADRNEVVDDLVARRWNNGGALVA